MITRLSTVSLNTGKRVNVRWLLVGAALAIAAAAILFVLTRRQAYLDETVKPQSRFQPLRAVVSRRSA